jgi:hypothetical protein
MDRWVGIGYCLHMIEWLVESMGRLAAAGVLKEEVCAVRRGS